MDLPRHHPVPAPHGLHRRHRPIILIGNYPVNGRLEVGKKWEPDAGPDAVGLTEDAVVCQRVIIEEKPRRDVERYEDVDRVVLMSSKDEEDGEDVEYPAGCV